MKEKMTGLEGHKTELTTLFAEVPSDVPDILPGASAVNGKQAGRLTEPLNKPEDRLQAAETLRSLVEKIVLTPGRGKGGIDATPYGEMDTILTWIEGQAIGESL